MYPYVYTISRLIFLLSQLLSVFCTAILCYILKILAPLFDIDTNTSSRILQCSYNLSSIDIEIIHIDNSKCKEVLFQEILT